MDPEPLVTVKGVLESVDDRVDAVGVAELSQDLDVHRVLAVPSRRDLAEVLVVKNRSEPFHRLVVGELSLVVRSLNSYDRETPCSTR